MNDDINIYVTRKLIDSIMFDFYDNNYKEDPCMFDLIILECLKSVVEARVKDGDLSKAVIDNINNYLQQARDYQDEKIIERIKLINEIIIMMNSQKYDDLLIFYRMQLIYRRRDFYYAIKCTKDEIKSEMDNVHESICYDLVVLESHSENVSDEEFANEYLPDLVNNQFYYESLNIMLKENPKVFRNKIFYDRMMSVLSLNEQLNNNDELTKINKKLVKQVKRKRR